MRVPVLQEVVKTPLVELKQLEFERVIRAVMMVRAMKKGWRRDIPRTESEVQLQNDNDIALLTDCIEKLWKMMVAKYPGAVFKA